jgi:hypothetical protein
LPALPHKQHMTLASQPCNSSLLITVNKMEQPSCRLRCWTVVV